jgi:carboxylesterase
MYKMAANIIRGADPISVLGDKTGILLLHGFTGSPFEMKYLVEAAQNKGYTVEAPLFKGHGTSVKELKSAHWIHWFEDAKKALFNLRKKCNKIVIIGLSMGATIGLHLAAHYQVEGVAALSPSIKLKPFKLRYCRYLYPIIRYIRKNKTKNFSEDFRQLDKMSYPKVPIKSIRQLHELNKHVMDDLTDIYVPILLMHSAKDKVIDAKSVRGMHDKISSAHKIMLQLKESGHIMSLDVEKEIVIREVLKFIGDIKPA